MTSVDWQHGTDRFELGLELHVAPRQCFQLPATSFMLPLQPLDRDREFSGSPIPDPEPASPTSSARRSTTGPPACRRRPWPSTRSSRRSACCDRTAGRTRSGTVRAARVIRPPGAQRRRSAAEMIVHGDHHIAPLPLRLVLRRSRCRRSSAIGRRAGEQAVEQQTRGSNRPAQPHRRRRVPHHTDMIAACRRGAERGAQRAPPSSTPARSRGQRRAAT